MAEGPGKLFRDEAGKVWRQRGTSYEEIPRFKDEGGNVWLQVDGQYQLDSHGQTPPAPPKAGPVAPEEDKSAVAERALESARKEMANPSELEAPASIRSKWTKLSDRPPDIPASVPKDWLDEMFWERRGVLSKLFKDPKRAAEYYAKKGKTALSETKRPSLGGHTIKELVEGSPGAAGSLVKGASLGTPAAFLRKAAQEVPAMGLDLGGAVVGASLRAPESYHAHAAKAAAPGSAERRAEAQAAKDWLETAQGATSTGNTWRQLMDEILPGKELAESSPIQGLAEGTAEALPSVVAMLTGNKTAGGRKLVNLLINAKAAAEGINTGTEAGLSPADTLKLALGRSTIRAIENRVPLSGMTHKSLGGGKLASVGGSLLDAGVFNTMRNAQTDDFLAPVTGQRTDKDQGFWESAVTDYALRTLLHQNPAVKSENELRLKNLEELVSKKGGDTEIEKLKNFLKATKKVREDLAVKAYKGEREGRAPLSKLSEEFNIMGRKADADRVEPGNINPAKILGEAPAPGDFTDPFTQLRTLAGGDLQIPRVQPKGWFEGLLGKPRTRPDLGLQKEIESAKYGKQSDVDVAASWSATVKKKYNLSDADLKAMDQWLGAAQANYDLGVTDTQSGPMPKGAVRLPELSPNQVAALQERAGVASGSSRDFAYKHTLDTATRLMDLGVPIGDIRKAFETGKLNTRRLGKNPRALGEVLKISEQIPDQPHYSPRVFEGDAPEGQLHGSAGKSKSVHEITRAFGTLVDDNGDRTFVMKTGSGKIVPVGMVDDGSGQMVFGAKGPAYNSDDMKAKGLKYVTATPEEVEANTGKSLSSDPLLNLGAARADVRGAARNKAWMTALVKDPELVGKNSREFPRRPDVAVDDPTIQRAQSAIYDRSAGKLHPGVGFRGDVANVLDANFGRERLGKASKAASAANYLQDLYTRLSLINPIVHGGNVVEHPMKEYGAKALFAGDPAGDKALLDSAAEMIRQRHPLYQQYIQSGGRDLSLARRAEKGYKALHGDTKGEGLSRLLGGEGDPMSRSSRLGLDQVSDEVIWKPDAAMRFALWMRKVESGVDPKLAHKAVAETQPNYSIPVNLIDDPGGNSPVNKTWRMLTGQRNETPDAAALAKLLRPMFFRYRHNSIASTLNTAKDLTNLDSKGIDKAVILAGLMQGPYKGISEGYSQLAGDDENKFAFREPGTNHYLKLLGDLQKGAISGPELIDRLYTPPPVARAAVGLAASRDPATGRSLHGEKIPFLAESFMPQGYAISNLMETRDPARFFGSNLLQRPERTDAEKIASFMGGQQTLGTRAYGTTELDQFLNSHKQGQARADVRRMLKEGDQDGLKKILGGGDVNLSKKSVSSMLNNARLPREMVLAKRVENLDKNAAMDVFEKMTDMEKIASFDVMIEKFTHGGTPNQLRDQRPEVSKLKKMYNEAIDNLETGLYTRQYPMFKKEENRAH